MSRQAYFDYLEEVWEDIEDHFDRASSETKRVIFKLIASPYYYWEKPSYQEYLEFIAQSSPKASSVGNGIEESGSESTKSTRASKSSMSPDTEDAKESSGHRTHDARGYPVKVSASSESEDSSNLANAEHAPLDDQALLRLGKANLADRAREIRSFVRANVNDKERKHMTKSALHALEMLLREGKWAMISEASDGALVAWFKNWVEKVKP